MKSKKSNQQSTDSKDELADLFGEALDKLQEGKELSGKDGALRPLIKRLLEVSLDAELDAHVGKSNVNRRNGRGRKTVKTSHGPVDIDTGRDRDGSFEPQIIGKRQTTLGASVDNKILSLYAMGMSYRDIREHVDELYGLSLSPATLSAITDQIWPEVQQWRERPLDSKYACVWLDAMYYKVREEGLVEKRAVYMVLARKLNGHKELLGFYVSKSESAKFWLQVLNDLQQRGVEDILICCIDNLKGFVQAIESVFPKTDVQLCVVHQVRNSMRYVPWSDQREVVRDLKEVYRADTEEKGWEKLEAFEQKWAPKYKPMVDSWKRNWPELATMYKYPAAIRKMIYTTNMIEGFHRQIRKATKTKGAFSNEKALIKLLYLAQDRIARGWKKAPREWKQILNALVIFFEDRIKDELERNDTV